MEPSLRSGYVGCLRCIAVALNIAWFVPLAGCVASGRHAVMPNNPGIATLDTAHAIALQSAVMSMSDDWNSALGAMAYEMQRECGSDMECMWVTQAFLRNGMGASLDVAVGPNPSVAIMDMLVLCSLETWTLEHHWAGLAFRFSRVLPASSCWPRRAIRFGNMQPIT